MTTKLSWFYNRLKAMPPEEVIYRIKKTGVHNINKILYKKSVNIDEIENYNIDLEKLYKNLKNIFNEIDIDSININNNYEIFDKNVDLNKSIDWHNGTNGVWDKNISSYDIEFKNTDNIGDIRFTWEINRHQFMPYLASAYVKTKDNLYLDLLSKHLKEWIEENKYLKGINWTSSMEIALRAYQWIVVLYLLEEADIIELKRKIINCIIISIKYVMSNLSLYSSANNHLILEVAISSIIGLAFKGVYKQSWFEQGYNILSKELKEQFYDDGVNKEQALHYQGFVTDMMLQYNSILKKLGYDCIEEELIKKSVEFILSLGADKHYIDFGDSDDAKILTLSLQRYNYYHYILSFASLYYGKKYVENYDKYTEISLFMHKYTELDKVEKKSYNLFRKGGYAVINNKNDIVVFDFGELGFGNLAAHGHADALMINYYRDGNPIFIDSGTYIYNIEREKRDYYRSTKAHNTLCYNNKNQSEIKGPFLWGKKSNSNLLNTMEDNNKIIIEAQNDGYSPSVHKRKIVYYKSNKDITICDYFDKPAELNFILDDKVSIEIVKDNILKLKNSKDIYMYYDGTLHIEDTMISKKFMEEISSKKINIKYNFDKEHYIYISDNISNIYKFISERGRI